MKRIKVIYGSLLTGLILTTACNKQIDAIKPLSYISAEGELSTLPGILETTNGNYTNLTNTGGAVFGNNYETVMHNISEFRGNNLTADFNLVNRQFRDPYSYSNSGLPGYCGHDFWHESYQLIIGINTVLGGIKTFQSSGGYGALSATQKNQLLHAEGENLFLRGLAYFNLVRVYGMPYYQNPETNPGVMIKNDDDLGNIPGRSTIKQSYDQIISDLQQAAALMNGTGNQPNIYANADAARALLSRVFLYMGGTFISPDNTYNQSCITYADSVINSGQYQLLQGQAYINMFAPDIDGSLGRANVKGNNEVIFAFDHSRAQGDVDQFYHYLNYYGTLTGGFYPSQSFMSLIATNDVRGNFLWQNPITGKTETSKYLVQPQAWLSNAPYIYLRLAEVYLNRAEAEVKTGNNADALNDLNTIHTRAGLVPLTGLTGQDLFNAILRERRIELAFEGQNSFDDFRNGLPMIRPSEDTGGQPFIIQPTDPKVVMRIPFDDIASNPKLKQNDQ